MTPQSYFLPIANGLFEIPKSTVPISKILYITEIEVFK